MSAASSRERWARMEADLGVSDSARPASSSSRRCISSIARRRGSPIGDALPCRRSSCQRPPSAPPSAQPPSATGTCCRSRRTRCARLRRPSTARHRHSCVTSRRRFDRIRLIGRCGLPLRQRSAAGRARRRKPPVLAHDAPEVRTLILPLQLARRTAHRGTHDLRERVVEIDDAVIEPHAAVADGLSPTPAAAHAPTRSRRRTGRTTRAARARRASSDPPGPDDAGAARPRVSIPGPPRISDERHGFSVTASGVIVARQKGRSDMAV